VSFSELTAMLICSIERNSATTTADIRVRYCLCCA